MKVVMSKLLGKARPSVECFLQRACGTFLAHGKNSGSFAKISSLRSFATSERPLHVFDQALTLTPSTEVGEWISEVHPAYANMIGPFGGITLAQALHAIMIDSRRQGDPTSITLNFVAPISTSPFKITSVLKKTNRSTQHWTVDFVQNEETVVSALIMCAVRKGNFDHLEATMPDVPAPESVSRSQIRYPEWTSRYDMRYITGEPSVTKLESGPSPPLSANSKTVVWVKDALDRPIDFQSISAMMDAFYPRIYILRPLFIPAGTVSITVYFHVCSEELSALGSDFLLGEARASIFHRSYADQSATMWTRGGRLLATSTQCVYFKA
jgi:acyl-CoA thioesterase